MASKMGGGGIKVVIVVVGEAYGIKELVRIFKASEND